MAEEEWPVEFTHFDEHGNARMVDVSGKEITSRTAVAEGRIQVSPEVFRSIEQKSVKKGDVLTVAQVAGIMGCKRTAELVPMCHLLNLTNAALTFELLPETLEVLAVCTVKTDGKTGVEMEALTGVSVALLTIYDMCKAIDKRMVIKEIHLVEKHGGKSGDFFFGQGGEKAAQ
ncbi:MAG: cyclic pyranopterin monophosphate synthase MoaC [Oscillospiraceae bacterium]|nr:cyclic pyranopterin monophosphate synthase MoaC [Oscillospiraceae bacterium]